MKESNNRNNNLDLLRNICCIFVVIIHVSAIWLNYIENKLLDNNFIFCLINTMSKFSVPVFFMISGYLNISNEKNVNYKYFLKKTKIKIIVPCILFSIFYSLIKIFESYINKNNILLVLKDIMKGNLGALWFLYALIPIYLITPCLVYLRKNSNRGDFESFCWIYFAYSAISGLFSNFSVSWALGSSANYLGFYLIGYILGNKKYSKTRLNIFINLLLLVLLPFINSILVYKYNFIENIDFNFSNNFNPINIIYSIIIFILMFKINIPFSSYKLSKYTFGIYLIHPFFISIYTHIIKTEFLINNYYIKFVMMLGIIFAFSLLFSYLYNYIYNKLLSIFVKN